MTRPRAIRDLRRCAIALAALLCACRSVPRRECFPASGREVWIERHLRAQSSNDGRSIVEVRFVPDTSAQRHGHHQQAMLLMPDQRDGNASGALRRDFTPKTPAVLRLESGAHKLMVLALSYERTSRTVDVAPGYSILIEVQLAGAAYCEEIVTVMQARKRVSEPPALDHSSISRQHEWEPR